jgi:hypothetical protein
VRVGSQLRPFHQLGRWSVCLAEEEKRPRPVVELTACPALPFQVHSVGVCLPVLALDVPGVVIELYAHRDVLVAEVKIWAAEVDHPCKRQVSQSLVRVAAANIAVDPREPDLPQVDRW